MTKRRATARGGIVPRATGAWWSLAAGDLYRMLDSGATGLGKAEARRRRRAGGANELDGARPLSRLRVLWGQLRNPLLLLLLLVALIVRTRRSLFRSRPGSLLLWSTVGVVVLTLALPYLPVAGWLGFVPLPPSILGAIILITVLYTIAAEVTKSHFYRSAERAQ